MKMYFVKIGIVFFVLLSFLSEKIVFASLPLAGKKIVIDSGHGGLDPGTMYKDIYEKDINLSISLALEEELKKLGAEVILIRYYQSLNLLGVRKVILIIVFKLLIRLEQIIICLSI